MRRAWVAFDCSVENVNRIENLISSYVLCVKSKKFDRLKLIRRSTPFMVHRSITLYVKSQTVWFGFVLDARRNYITAMSSVSLLLHYIHIPGIVCVSNQLEVEG